MQRVKSNLLTAFGVFALVGGLGIAADVTIFDLTATTTPVGGDEIEMQLAGDGASRKTTFTNASKALDASNIPNTPAGGIAATDIQGAIDELDTEKGAGDFLADGTVALTGALNLGTVGQVDSAVADGAAAVAFDLDTSNTLATAGAKLLSIKNNTVERLYMTYDGVTRWIFGSGYLLQFATDGGGVLITSSGDIDVAGRDIAADGALLDTALQNIVEDTTPQAGGDIDMQNNHIENADEVEFTEKADHTSTPAAGNGILWTKNTTPSSLVFTDDAGTDRNLSKDWASCTVVTTWDATATITAQCKEVGDELHVRVKVASTGAQTVGLDVDLPSGYTINGTKIISTAAAEMPLGQAIVHDAGASYYPGPVAYLDSNTVRAYAVNASATSATLSGYTASNPITWASGDNVGLRFTVPID